MLAGYKYTLAKFQENGVIFSTTQDDAARIVAYYSNAVVPNSGGVPMKFTRQTMGLPKTPSGNVKTIGEWTPNGATATSKQGPTETIYNNLVLFLNNYMLAQLIKPDVSNTAGLKILITNPGNTGKILDLPLSAERRQTEGIHCYGSMRTTITKEYD
jgi:hypothetical protein